MAALVPDARLVAILRNPVDRTISAYHFARKMGQEERPLEEAIAANLRRLATVETLAAYDDFHGPLRLNNYVSRGHYAESLERWFQHFDRSQVLVLESEELSRSGEGYERVVGHLGLPPWRPPAFVEHNAGSYEAAPPAVRKELIEHFRPYNEQLWKLVGEDWRWDEKASLTG
jgi:hypothetical protein